MLHRRVGDVAAMISYRKPPCAFIEGGVSGNDHCRHNRLAARILADTGATVLVTANAMRLFVLERAKYRDCALVR